MSGGLNRLDSSGRRRSQKQENRIAEEIGGRVTPMSGAGWMRKNDVRNGRWSWEAKTTRGKQFILKIEELRRAWVQAVADNRVMAWEIEFGDERYVVVEKNDFAELCERAGG